MEWRLPIPEAAKTIARETPDDRPLLAINPCGSVRLNNFRNWSAENHAAVCNHAWHTLGMRIVLTGGPAENEREMAANILDSSTAGIIDLTGKTSLKQLLAVLDNASVVIAPDTGPMHLAAALGKPVIGLFATSNPDRTGPYRDQRFIVNRYPEALKKDRGETVQEARWGKRVRNPDAMSLVTVEDVTAKLDVIMSNRAACPAAHRPGPG